MKRRNREAEEIAGYVVAEALVRRAAGLLRGGMPAPRVWRVLSAEEGEAEGEAERTVLAVIESKLAAGGDSASAIADVGSPQWRALAAMWHVAELSGSPIAEALDRFATAMAMLTKLAEHRRVLLAGPRATLRLVLALPPVALLVGALLGFDPLQALASPPGLAAALTGLALLGLGAWWAAVLTRRVGREDWIAGWEFELMAIGLRGGAPPGLAGRWAVDCADEARAEWVHLEAFAFRGAVTRAVAAGAALGGPLANLLRAEAERARARAQAELEQAAERLAIRVLYPLGACVLPAFILLGVMPVLLAVLGGAGV